MNRLEALKIITADAAGKPLHFAGHIEIGLRIRDALAQDDCSMETASRLIQAEPALSAQVVAIANSVAYNPYGREITEVKTAVARLGFATLRSLAAAHIVKHMAGAPSNPDIKSMTDRLWRHTTHVAALCRTIARRVTQHDPDTALFIGLVHEVGGFYLLSRAVEYPMLLEVEPPPGIEAAEPSFPDEAELLADGDDDPSLLLEGELTLAVLRQLGTPAAVIAAVDEYYKGYMGLPPSTLGDTLLLAESLAPVRSPLSAVVDNDESVHASIDAVIGQTTLQEILRESTEEVSSLARALGTG